MARRWTRRGVAVVGAVASFGGCYWGLVVAYPAIDTGTAVGWSALPLTIALGVLLGWAERSEPDEHGQSAPSVCASNLPVDQARLSGNVTNTVTGGVQYGPVLQGRNLTGLTFNMPTPPDSLSGPQPEKGER